MGYGKRTGWVCGRGQDALDHPHRAAPTPREQFSSSLGPSQIHLQHHSMALSAPTPWEVKAKHHRKSCQESWVTRTKKKIKFSNNVCYSSPPLIFHFKSDNPHWAVIFINTPCPWVLPAQHIPLVTEWYQLDHDSREEKTPKPTICTLPPVQNLVVRILDTITPSSSHTHTPPGAGWCSDNTQLENENFLAITAEWKVSSNDEQHRQINYSSQTFHRRC